MTNLRFGAGLAVVVGLATGGSLVAAQGNLDGKKYDKGATVTLQGCVIAGQKKDTYVLRGVKEWPIGNSEMGRHGPRMYWIDKRGDDMQGHLGHTIELTGNSGKLDAFIQGVDRTAILETVRTGGSGVGRGERVLRV